MIHIFQAVAEQPEWLDTVLNLWSEAGGWVNLADRIFPVSEKP